MIKLQKNFTTPEQSKRLLELGLPTDSADMFYNACLDRSTVIPTILNIAEKPQVGTNTNEYPCWSVGRLIEIFETCTYTKFERWSYKGVFRPLLEDCIEHIKFALNPDTTTKFDFLKLEE